MSGGYCLKKNLLRYVWIASNVILYVLIVALLLVIVTNLEELKALGQLNNWLLTVLAVFLFAALGTLRIRRSIKSGQV